ncbi:MAG: aminomethyl-transferring glycine dehydrogenase subunit GcvPA [Planctomycetes bacterium]|nr:aminomethyl-transferring glycine dehydrogenase subunit GcvPA [Planctomycetota bacterium]
MRYSATTPETRGQMLAEIGVNSVADLLKSIPDAVRMNRPLEVAGPLAEADLRAHLESIKTSRPRVSFVGAGLYDHYIPAPVESLCARSEWVTSYTPYQPELAQGTLAMYYEFQTYMARLTGQEIANGGMYDGSTALAEAVLMAMRIRPKADPIIFVSDAVHPQYRAVLATYMRFVGVEIATMSHDPKSGRTLDLPAEEAQSKAIAVIFQSPNYFGVIEELEGVAADAFKIGVCTEALSMAVLPPLPVDIMVGDAQSFGIPMQLGGPTAGFFATRKEWVRKLPGRLVGRTVDAKGEEAFCITLATREQFIRREKATSNICTSSGLMCLRATVYLSLLGGAGLTRLAESCAKTTRYFVDGLAKLGIKRAHDGAFFNEVVLDARAATGLYEKLLAKDILLGLPLADLGPAYRDHYLFAATEQHYSRAEAILEEVRSLA